jgi:hypothetical protein
MRHLHGSTWLSLLLAIVLPGCGLSAGAPSVSSSLEEATVKGIVRIQGKAVNNGEITFHAANINRPDVPIREARMVPRATRPVTYGKSDRPEMCDHLRE